MAPEIILSREDFDRGGRGIQITSAVDMWSFGIILYEMSVAYSPLRVKPNLVATTGNEVGDQSLFKQEDWIGKSH
jgi:serine/threonine protein kinase